MKQIFLINSHSFIDVITNSSTELFVCGTDKTVEMVEEILNNELICHSGYYVRRPTQVELLKSKYKTRTRQGEWGSRYVLLSDMSEEDAAFLKNSRETTTFAGEPAIGIWYGYELELTPDTVIVEGTQDNSIGWNDCEKIEEVLGARRYHLG